MRLQIATLLLPLLPLLAFSACGDEPVPLAPRAEVLKEAAPKTETAMKWSVQSAGSKVRFEMQAPFERQEGEVPEPALSGSLHVELKDLTKSTGLIAVDISALEPESEPPETSVPFSATGEEEYPEVPNLETLLAEAGASGTSVGREVIEPPPVAGRSEETLILFDPDEKPRRR
jgi:hypothetical protein